MAVINIDDYRHHASRMRRPAQRRAAPTRERSEQIEEPKASSWRARLRLWRERRRRRAMIRDELLPQPDSVLADAGLTREEATEEASKPFWRA